MTEDEKKILEEEFRKAGSVPALLEAMARSETMEFQALRRQVEQGPHHPTWEDLYNYVLDWMDKEESLLVMDHLFLCSRCLREVIRIRRLEEAMTKADLARADKVPLLERIKSFISKLSFPVSIYAPALEGVRGVETEPQERHYTTGTGLVISGEAPADGYVAVFHVCEETSKVELVFPLYSTDDPRVVVGQEMPSVTGTVEKPPGKHWFKLFWTRIELLDPKKSDLQDEDVRCEAVESFFDALEELSPDDWRTTTIVYEVVAE